MRIAHLGTYPPRKCGIATYTHAVVHALEDQETFAPAFVSAMVAPGEEFAYPLPVQGRILQNDLDSYARAACQINRSGAELVNIQYEHGIFGGENGYFLTRLLDGLTLPAVATLHTVVPAPSRGMVIALRALADRTAQLVVLNQSALPLLRSAYGIGTTNVTVIPHGTPDMDRTRRQSVRAQRGLGAQTVLATFGLIGPDKGLEFAIAAVAQLAPTHPNLHYYILGQTHPQIVQEHGEVYRNSLIRLAAEAGVSDRIHFVNEYLTPVALTDWLVAIDVYITPYLNADQIVSGTLAYAVAAGKCVLATPYLHAQELLSGGRGVLIPFRDAPAIAASLARVLSNPEQKAQMEHKAWAFGRTSQWSEVAQRYSEVFRSALVSRARRLLAHSPAVEVTV